MVLLELSPSEHPWIRLGNESLGDDVNPLCLKHLHGSELKGVKNRRQEITIITKDSDDELGDEI